MTHVPSGLQTFSHSFADQGCFIFSMCGIALESLSLTSDSSKENLDNSPLYFCPAMDPLGAAYYGVRNSLVSDDRLMKVLNYPKFMDYLTEKPGFASTWKWSHRKEDPGYTAIPGEYLIGRYSGILRVNPIKHYVRLKPDGRGIYSDSMVKSPITKKGDLTSVHVFWRVYASSN